MTACKSIGIDAARCDALQKELSAENKIRLMHRIRTRSPRFGCSRKTETIVWQLFFTNQHSDLNNVMACPALNIEKLINLVQKYQFLYNKSHKYYCNNIIRENIWTEISNSLDNTTANYMILYSVIYILCSFCNICNMKSKQLWHFTIMTIISIINNNKIN